MHQLLKKDREFIWTETFSDKFKAMCKVLCSKITLSSFNKDFKTKLLMGQQYQVRGRLRTTPDKSGGKITVVRCGLCSVPRLWHSLSAMEVEAAE